MRQRASRAPPPPCPPLGPGRSPPALCGGPWRVPAHPPVGVAWYCGLCKGRRRVGVSARTRATGAQRMWGPAGALGSTEGQRPRGLRVRVRGRVPPSMRRCRASSSVRLHGPAGGFGQGHAATWAHRAHLLAPVDATEDTMPHSPQSRQVCGRWEGGDQGSRWRSQRSSHLCQRGSQISSRRARTRRRYSLPSVFR